MGGCGDGGGGRGDGGGGGEATSRWLTREEKTGGMLSIHNSLVDKTHTGAAMRTDHAALAVNISKGKTLPLTLRNMLSTLTLIILAYSI